MTPTSPSLPTLYRRYFPALAAKCRRIVGSSTDADDVAQEAFLRFLDEGPSATALEEPRAALAWLYRTSTRIAIDHLRARRRRAVSQPPEELARMKYLTAEPTEISAARSELLRLVREAPDDEIDVVVMCRLDGMTHEEAGAVLSLSARTVRRYLARFDGRREAPVRETT